MFSYSLLLVLVIILTFIFCWFNSLTWRWLLYATCNCPIILFILRIPCNCEHIFIYFSNIFITIISLDTDSNVVILLELIWYLIITQIFIHGNTFPNIIFVIKKNKFGKVTPLKNSTAKQQRPLNIGRWKMSQAVFL